MALMVCWLFPAIPGLAFRSCGRQTSRAREFQSKASVGNAKLIKNSLWMWY